MSKHKTHLPFKAVLLKDSNGLVPYTKRTQFGTGK